MQKHNRTLSNIQTSFEKIEFIHFNFRDAFDEHREGIYEIRSS